MFTLHPRLAADSHPLGRFPLSLVRLINDANYPWCILVPQIAGLRELHELDGADRLRLTEESAALGRALCDGFAAHKLNVGALGNLVPQLHLHHVVRQPTDAAWPGPVWGAVATVPYTAARRVAVSEVIVAGLAGVQGFRRP